MKKIIYLIIFSVITFLGLYNPTGASGLVGERQILQCLAAIKSNNITQQGNIIHPIDSRRKFMCIAKEDGITGIGSSRQGVLYQAIVDILFTKVDLQVESYLKSLQKSNGNLVKAIQDARRKLGVYGESETGGFAYQYNQICSYGIRAYASEFVGKNKLHPLITDGLTRDVLIDYSQSGRCYILYKLKLASYFKAAEVIINKANMERFSTSRMEYVSDIRTKYNDFLFKLTTYIGQLGVIYSKWNTKTLQVP